MLRHDEGMQLKPYRCSAGKLTIGVGRNLDDNGITITTANQMLDEDIDHAVASAVRIVGIDSWATMHPMRQLGMINMLFNLGEERFRKWVPTIVLIKQKRWQAVADRIQFHNPKYREQVGSRVDRIAAMFRDGSYPY